MVPSYSLKEMRVNGNVFTFCFHICVPTTVLQGVWGEPYQMPNMSRDNTVQAEAILGMIATKPIFVFVPNVKHCAKEMLRLIVDTHQAS
jgi:hypothetical protein